MAIAPIPPFPALSDRANGTYNGKAFDWASHMANTFVPEANALAANLNSIAAGGAYAIPYTFTGAVTNGAVNTSPNVNQNATSVLTVWNIIDSGKSVFPILAQFDASSSVIKGQIRLQKTGDPSKWLVFNVTGRTPSGDGQYQVFSGAVVDASDANPFSGGDAVMLFFQRTGDKGDTGLMGIYPAAKFSDRKTASTSAGDSIAGTQTRTLNTAEYNTIAGASMSGNQITLPAGTYEVSGRVPGYAVNGHKAFFYNVSDGAPAIVGSSASSPNPSGTQTDSVFDGRITITATKVFSIRHYTETAALGSALGRAANGSGQHEVFAEITLTKIA